MASDCFLFQDAETAAEQMVDEHGLQAGVEAFRLAAKMLEQQDFERYEIWRAILDSINNQRRTSPIERMEDLYRGV